jgi:hypothetical protein
MFLFEGDLVPARNNIVQLMSILDTQVVSSGVPGCDVDELLNFRKMLSFNLALSACVGVKNIIL